MRDWLQRAQVGLERDRRRPVRSPPRFKTRVRAAVVAFVLPGRSFWLRRGIRSITRIIPLLTITYALRWPAGTLLSTKAKRGPATQVKLCETIAGRPALRGAAKHSRAGLQ